MSKIKIGQYSNMEAVIEFLNSLKDISGTIIPYKLGRETFWFYNLGGVIKDECGNYYLKINDFDEIKFDCEKTYLCGNHLHLHLKEQLVR